MTESIPYLMAIVAGLLGVAGLVGVAFASSKTTQQRGASYLTYLPTCILLSAAAAIVTTGRDVSTVVYAVGPVEAKSGLSMLATRLTSIILLVSSVHLIVTRSGADGTLRQRLPLLFAFVTMWALSTLAPAMLGAHRAFSHEYFYCLLVGVGLIALSDVEGVLITRATRDAIAFFILGGLLLIPVRASMVLDLGYVRGLIPHLPRFAGLAPHPVAMGLISLVGILCWMSEPHEKRWLNRLEGLVLFLGYFLAQSKTSWLAGLLAITLLQSFSHFRHLYVDVWNKAHRNVWIGVIGGVMTVLIAVVGLTTFDILPSKLAALSHTSAGMQMLSLTGRDQIWKLALEEWHRHPIFGYGPSIFDEQYRIAVGMLFAMHGHNQVIDALARSGLVGAAGVCLYFIVLAIGALRTATSSRGLSVALLVLVTLQCVSEVPLQLFKYGPENLPHFVLLAVVAANLSPRRSRARQPIFVPPHHPSAVRATVRLG